MIRAAVTTARGEVEQLRARFLELAPAGFEEAELGEIVELAAYGESALRILAEFPGAETRDIQDGWEERWREFHHGIRIGPLWVGPPWEEGPGDVSPVVIDPGRAFGTGSHPTTRLCLELLLDEQPGSLLDIGCGSGVLAIAAAKLGHGPVVALDFDEAAVAATQANAEVNGVEIEVHQLDALTGLLPAADLAVSNIALAAVETLGKRLQSDRVITSGYFAKEQPRLDGFTLLGRRLLDGWAADVHART